MTITILSILPQVLSTPAAKPKLQDLQCLAPCTADSTGSQHCTIGDHCQILRWPVKFRWKIPGQVAGSRIMLVNKPLVRPYFQGRSGCTMSILNSRGSTLSTGCTVSAIVLGTVWCPLPLKDPLWAIFDIHSYPVNHTPDLFAAKTNYIMASYKCLGPL